MCWFQRWRSCDNSDCLWHTLAHQRVLNAAGDWASWVNWSLKVTGSFQVHIPPGRGTRSVCPSWRQWTSSFGQVTKNTNIWLYMGIKSYSSSRGALFLCSVVTVHSAPPNTVNMYLSRWTCLYQSPLNLLILYCTGNIQTLY